MSNPKKICLTLLLVLSILSAAIGVSADEKKEKKKKDIRDYSDADLERLYEQWEEDDEPLPVDELPEWDPRRPQPTFDLNSMKQFKNPEEFLKVSKKGKTLMIFVKVSGNPTRDETEELTSLWQTGLWNSHIQADRFLLEDDRAIFMFKDGAVAWDAKDYLIEQERCEEVTIEQKAYPGKFSDKGKEEAKKLDEEVKAKAKKQKDKEKKKKEADKKKQKDQKNKKDKTEL